MKLRKICVNLALAITILAANADYLRFDNVAAEVQEHVVDCITNCIRTATIAVMHDEPWVDDAEKIVDSAMPWDRVNRLGLARRRCLSVMKGDSRIRGEFCYLYATPRMTDELPRLYRTVSHGATGQGVVGAEMYIDVDNSGLSNVVWVTGKERWRFHPPYDPYGSFQQQTTRLMLLTSQRELKRNVIKAYDVERVNKWVGGDIREMKPQEIAERLGIAEVFTDRVYRMNEGCSFHVDFPDAKGLTDSGADSGVIHLSQQELSEVVSLAFAVSKDGAGTYEDARRANPDLLLPVTECKTELGRRLRSALLPGYVRSSRPQWRQTE